MLSRPGRVAASAPCRADLAGGTLDIWPLGLLHPGAVTVNVALPVRVELEVARSADPGEVVHRGPEGVVRRLTAADAGHDLTAAVAFEVCRGGGLEVNVTRQAPVGSGLGGSSAYAVALAAGILRSVGEAREAGALVALCRDIEARVLGVPTGCQDHWAAVAGGVLALHLEPGRDRLEKLAVDPAWVGDRLTVVFTGITHRSGMVNWEVVRRRLDGDADAVDGFARIAAAAGRVRDALLARDHHEVAAAMAAEWGGRRRLAPEVCPPELDGAVDAALAAGAGAVKACGAGGGGSVAVWHRPGQRQAIAAGLLAALPGGRVLATAVEPDGLRVTEG